jgi:pyruvate,orthophosphate dikinase
MAQRIYRFSAGEVDGDASMVMLLGGKGANLAEMASMNIPVPPGFTLTTDCCNQFSVLSPGAQNAFMGSLMSEVGGHLEWLTDKLGHAPLLSVRSGAPVSMPGMMDTILNVGLTTDTMSFWQDKIGDRACADSYRRLIQMLGSTAYGVDMAKFDFQLASVKKLAGVTVDSDLNTAHLDKLIERYIHVFKTSTGLNFPDTVAEQVTAAVAAVFSSWMNPRAIEYRKINKIDAAMGTAVTVQAMVFGNMGETSGTGVLFSRNAASGAHEVLGEFLAKAQGEDVVAGIRTPLALAEMHKLWPEQHAFLMSVMERLEQHYRDMMDIEFTVQEGTLWLLQCRVGKRSALAAFKIAVQFVNEGHITATEAVGRLTRAQYRLVRRPRIPDSFKVKPHAIGNGASPGVAVGVMVFSAISAVDCKDPCILVTHETCPDDIAGMNAAQGILTATGGATSHAAVVARAMDKPCIVGCTDLELQGDGFGAAPCIVVDNVGYHEGSKVTICGDTGRVWFGVMVPVEDASEDDDVLLICQWALEAAGFSEQVASPLGGKQSLQTIKLADFWGNTARLQGMLAMIADLGTAKTTVLDANPPHSLTTPCDELLADCFGVSEYAPKVWGSSSLVALLLKSQTSLLKGLVVLAPCVTEDERGQLRTAGYHVGNVPKTLHDLLFADSVVLTESFMTSVVGSQQALNEVLSALEKAGKKTGIMQRAVPLEYATFSVLH